MTVNASETSRADSRPPYRRGPHWVALCAAVFTLPLLFVGGSVTTYRFGLAVPDWPTTFQVNMFLYDFWNAPFGVRVEHTHRLYGAAVGMATIFLTVWFLAFERRKWMKALGVLALLTVIVQGVLGGTRVTQTSTFLAAVHGCMGQAFFGLMVSLCVLTGRDWLSAARSEADSHQLRRRSAVLVGLIYAQIVLGAWLRHYGTIAALVVHAATALAVWSHAAALVWRVERHKRDVPALVPSARALALVVTLQVALGVLAWWLLLPFDRMPRPVSLWQAMVRTGHQTNGALLLAAGVTLALRRPASSGAGFHDVSFSFSLAVENRPLQLGGSRVKTVATLEHPGLAEPPTDAAWAAAGGKAAAYLALTKPRIAVMVLVTVATGFVLGARQATHPATLLLTLLGTGLVAGGASVWNQYIERFRDARMKRTANRPLPSGRVTPAEAAVFGTVLGVVGLVILAFGVNLTAAGVALVTFVLYVGVYTPLKWRTTLNTAIGAIPGALPPVIGWAAATGQLSIEAWSLFLIVFLWQFPHFLAIAWIYRDDYRRGGHKMLPVVDPAGVMTGRQASGYALALVPAGLLPAMIGLAGPYYFAGALALGVFYLTYAVRFWAEVGDASARRLLRASFLYLPAILVLLLLNPLPA